MTVDLVHALLLLILLLFFIDAFMLAIILIRDVQVEKLEKQVERLSTLTKVSRLTERSEQPWTY